MATREHRRAVPLPPSGARQAAAVVAAVVAGGLGALILGEYDMSGVTPYVAGVLFGLVIAEVVLTVARRATRGLVAAAATTSGLGFLWAAFISAGRVVTQIPIAGFVGLVLAVVVAAAWTRAPSRRHPPPLS